MCEQASSHCDHLKPYQPKRHERRGSRRHLVPDSPLKCISATKEGLSANPNLCSETLGLLFERNSPDRTVGVFCDEQSTIVRYRDSYRTPPNTCIGDESGQEIVVFPGGMAVMHSNSNHFVARALRSIP